MRTERLQDPHQLVYKISDSQGFTMHCKLSSHLWAGYGMACRLHCCLRFQMIWDWCSISSTIFRFHVERKKPDTTYISSREYSYYITDFTSQNHRHPYPRKPVWAIDADMGCWWLQWSSSPPGFSVSIHEKNDVIGEWWKGRENLLGRGSTVSMGLMLVVVLTNQLRQ